MLEAHQQAWNRINAKLSDYIRLSVPPSAQRAVQQETQADVSALTQFHAEIDARLAASKTPSEN